MKRFFAFTFLILYVFTSSGATIYFHQCSGATSISFTERDKQNTDCPLCAKHQDQAKDRSCAETNSCNDIDVKLDQLSEKLFSLDYSKSFLDFAPAITTVHWIHECPASYSDTAHEKPQEDILFCRNSSPPTYILNRNFRI